MELLLRERFLLLFTDFQNIDILKETTMKTERLALYILLSFPMCCLDSAWAESRPLNRDEKQYLLNSLRASPAYYSIDITYEQRDIVPGDIAQKNIEMMGKKTEEWGKKYNWSNPKFHPIGFFNSNREYVVLTKEKVKVEGAMRSRKDITYFSGEDATAVSRKITNIYNNRAFYYINKGEKTIHISEEPKFESISPLHFLHCGRLTCNMGIVGDIVRIADPNYGQKRVVVSRKEFLDGGTVQIDGSLAKQIECFNIDKVQKEYALFLDPNNWGICRKIIWYDIESGRASKMSEFKNFSIVKEGNDLYPHTIIYTYFDKEGKEEQKEVINISQVATNLPVADESLQTKTQDFADYEITDYRFSPPLKTLNSLK